MASSKDQESENPLLRIATLLDDLKHDEISVRVNSMRHLKEITEALGVERTRNELLPFLGDTVMDDEDEVLLVAAEEFGDLVAQVGGPAHIPSLLKVLEELASVDEPMVRVKAVESMYRLVKQMKKGAVSEYFIQIVRRLAEKDWFTSRSAACALFAAGYPSVSAETKAELRGLYGALCKDDNPTVRRAAAENIGRFAQEMDLKVVRKEIIPLFQELSTDDQDSVRLNAIKNVIAFASQEKDAEKKVEILKMVFNLAEDKAWRVKWTVADSFDKVAELILNAADEGDFKKYIRLYVTLLVDDEPEVKAAAVANLTKVGQIFKASPGGSENFSEQVIAKLGGLVSDSSDFVRAGVASVMFGLAPVVGEKKTTQYLVPLYMKLLTDSESNVRLNLIASLDSLDNTIKLSYIQKELLPSVADLATDNQWRIRHSTIGHIPLVAKHLGEETFNTELVDLCLSWLSDEVFSIRQAATENLKELTLLFGEKWARAQLFEKIEDLSGNKSYLFRMQALRSIEALATVVGADTLNKELLPIVLRLGGDSTPNIRFNVAKTLEKIAELLSKEKLKTDVLEVLKKMEKDDDEDVKYFAGRAADEVKTLLDK